MRNEDVVEVKNLAWKEHEFEIRWRMTNLCNYSCKFCIQGSREEHLRNARSESATTRRKIAAKIREKLDEISGAYSSAYVQLIGGEITILQDFLPLIETIASTSFQGDVRIQITTNFSGDVELYRRLFDIIKKYDSKGRRRKLHFGVSFYKAYVDQAPFVEKLRNLVEYARGKTPSRLSEILAKIWRRLIKRSVDNSPHVSFSITYPVVEDSDYYGWLDMERLVSDLNATVSPVIIRNYNITLSPELKEKIVEQASTECKRIVATDCQGNKFLYDSLQNFGHEIEGRDSFCPKGMFCDAGVGCFYIDVRGEAFRCPVIGMPQPLGNFIGDTFHLLKSAEVCNADHCSCAQFGVIFRKR